MNTPENTNGQNGKNLKVLLILLFILLLATGGLSIWQYTEYKKLNKTLDSTEIKLTESNAAKDSLNSLLLDFEERLNQLEEERAALGDYSLGLEEEVAQLKQTINTLKARVAKANPEELARLRVEIAEMGKKTSAYEAQIEALIDENEELKRNQEELKEGIKALVYENKNLDDKVKKASEAQYAPIIVEAGRMRKNGFSPETKVRRIEEIRVQVDVIENPIINDQIEQSIGIRLIDPNKSVLAKVVDNSQLVDKSEIYSIKHNFMFDGKSKKILLKFEPDTKLVKGEYKLEFWAGGILKQTAKFELK
jgi:septal ring factor EnvC (AmiA/AmiB activator)